MSTRWFQVRERSRKTLPELVDLKRKFMRYIRRYNKLLESVK